MGPFFRNESTSVLTIEWFGMTIDCGEPALNNLWSTGAFGVVIEPMEAVPKWLRTNWVDTTAASSARSSAKEMLGGTL